MFHHPAKGIYTVEFAAEFQGIHVIISVECIIALNLEEGGASLS